MGTSACSHFPYLKADVDRVGQAELYDTLEKVLIELKTYTPHSLPFIHRVSKKDVPDYYEGTPTTVHTSTSPPCNCSDSISDGPHNDV